MKTIGMASWTGLGLIERPGRAAGVRRERGDSLVRGVALFFGTFGLLNVLSGMRRGGFDGSLWWIDLRGLPSGVASGCLFISALCLIAFGMRRPTSRWRRVLTMICVGTLASVALANAIKVSLLLARGMVGSAFPIPLSLLIAAALGAVFVTAARRAHDPPNRRTLLRVLAVCAGCAVLFPLLQMFCFGKTDYRRAADVIIVTGARVYADGQLSDALADRVRTACRLYQQGLAHKLILSGGPGDGAITEPEGMKRMAVRLGVKSDDVILDNNGLNTQATVRNSLGALDQMRAQRVLVVSHFYHLPRLKLSYQRAGREVYTVPAKESYVLRQLPYNIAREVAALWVYYVRAVIG